METRADDREKESARVERSECMQPTGPDEVGNLFASSRSGRNKTRNKKMKKEDGKRRM